MSMSVYYQTIEYNLNIHLSIECSKNKRKSILRYIPTLCYLLHVNVDRRGKRLIPMFKIRLQTNRGRENRYKTLPSEDN